MTAEEEEKFDEDWASTLLEEEAAFEAEREVAGWADMDDNQKAIWNGELLKW